MFQFQKLSNQLRIFSKLFNVADANSVNYQWFEYLQFCNVTLSIIFLYTWTSQLVSSLNYRLIYKYLYFVAQWSYFDNIDTIITVNMHFLTLWKKPVQFNRFSLVWTCIYNTRNTIHTTCTLHLHNMHSNPNILLLHL